MSHFYFHDQSPDATSASLEALAAKPTLVPKGILSDVDSALASLKVDRRLSSVENDIPQVNTRSSENMSRASVCVPNNESADKEKEKNPLNPSSDTNDGTSVKGDDSRSSTSAKPDPGSLMQAKGRLRAASITQNGVLINNRRLSNVAAGLPPPKPDVGSLLNAKGRLRTSSISKQAGDSASSLSPIARESLAGVAGSNTRKQSLLDGILGRKQSILEAPLDSARGSKTNIAPSKSNSNSMVNLGKSGSNESMGSRTSIRDLRESDKNQSRKGSRIGGFLQKALGMKQEEEDPLPTPEEIAKLLKERDQEIAMQATLGDSVLSKAEKKALEMGSGANIAIASRPGSPSVRHKTVKSNSISAQGAAPVPKSKLVAKVNGSGQNSAVGSMESIPAK